MSDLKFHIILAYYARPKMVRNALNSIKELQYDNWHLSFIDDGSPEGYIGEPIVREILGNYLHKINFHYIPDTKQQKIAQGGSRHGEWMNKAIREVPSDVIVILCDDDALIPDYFIHLNKWYQDNPHKQYCYCWTWNFDPHHDNPGPHLIGRIRGHNHTHDLTPSCHVDSAQVTYRTTAHTVDGLKYLSPATANLDANMFEQLSNKYGLVSYCGCAGQYKANLYKDQLGQLGSQKKIVTADDVYAIRDIQ